MVKSYQILNECKDFVDLDGDYIQQSQIIKSAISELEIEAERNLTLNRKQKLPI
jgi:hypothetical protein